MKIIKLLFTVLVVLSLASCSIEVKDETNTPATVTQDQNSSLGIDIKARVWKGLLTASPRSLTTKIIAGSSSHSTEIPMTSQGYQNDSFPYKGRLQVGSNSVTFYKQCGFKVEHHVVAGFLGIFPISDDTTRIIPGGPDQFVTIDASNVLTYSGPIRLGPTTGNQTYPLDAYNNLVLTNYYHPPATVTVSKIVCTTDSGQACGANPATDPVPYITTSGLNQVLSCGDYAGIEFRCSANALASQQGVNVVFETTYKSNPSDTGQNYKIPVRLLCSPLAGG